MDIISCYYLVFDALCSVGVEQCISRLLKVEASRAKVSDHHRLTVSPKRVLQQASQLTVSKVHVRPRTLITTLTYER